MLALLALAGCAPTSEPAPSGTPEAAPPANTLKSLDATMWRLTLEPVEGGGKAFDETLRFGAGKERQLLLETLARTAGFVPASYSTPNYDAESGGPIGFEATLNNAAGESCIVNGKATDKAAWGTLRIRKADWTLQVFRFRGRPGK